MAKAECRIYVLIGDTTAELQTALRKGFSPFNVIGVDIKAKSVEMWRKAGGLAIQGSLDQIIMASKIRPHAIICDFCGGITTSTFNTFWISYMSLAAPGAIALNMLRGRDDINKMQEQEPYNLSMICRGLGLNPKSRGQMIYSKMLVDCFFFEPTIQMGFGNNVDGFMEFAVKISRRLAPKFYEYKSKDGGNWFDSMVMSMPPEATKHMDGTFINEFSRCKSLCHQAEGYIEKRLQDDKMKTIKRKLAALEAVRTMAINKNNGRMFRPNDYL
jgi:hypothetical protein